MQGRTNVKDGIALNATVSEMEVESGSIVAGDFVEYKTITSVENFITGASSISKDYADLGNNKYLFGAGSYIYLVELANGEHTILDTYGYTNPSRFVISKYDNENIFVGVVIGSSTFRLDVINVANNQLSVHDTLTITGKVVYSGLHYDETTRKILVLANQYGFVGVNSNLELQQPTWHNMPSNLMYVGYNSYRKGNILIASAKSDTSSNYTYLRKFIIDYANESLTLDTTLDSKTWDTMRGFLIGDYLVLAGATTTTTSGYKTLYVIDIRTMAITDYNALGVTSISYGVFDEIYFISTVYGSASKYWVKLLSLDKETGLVNLISENEVGGNLTIFLTIGKNYILYGISDNGSKICYLTYNEGHDYISDAEDKDYVKAYTGGKAIGVAKQSGVAGDTIEVYIPSV